MKLIDILEKLIHQKKIHNYYGLYEIFDFENKELPIIHDLGNIFEFEIDISNGKVPVYVTFTEIDDINYIKLPPLFRHFETMYEIGYGFEEEQISNQYAITDLRTISLVMYTITEICKKFVQKEQPDILLFFAESKDGTPRGEMQKLTMYREITKKYLPSEYVLFDKIRDRNGKFGFLIYRRDRFHGKNRLK